VIEWNLGLGYGCNVIEWNSRFRLWLLTIGAVVIAVLQCGLQGGECSAAEAGD
jgi:hypothetical protein